MACRTPPSQRAWAAFVSPALLLFAMCIHGIFEGLTLGIQVQCCLPMSPPPQGLCLCLHGLIQSLHLHAPATAA
jgi:hypothetical protein